MSTQVNENPFALGENRSLLDAQKEVGLHTESAEGVINAHDLPGLPTDVHHYGHFIEVTMLGLSVLSESRSKLIEAADNLKAIHADALRGSKATLSEKDKRELAEALETDLFYVAAKDQIAILQRAISNWEARRVRLNRDFEVALADYKHERAQH